VRAECIGLLAERVDLIGLAVAGNGFEAIPPRRVVLALWRAELEHKVAHDISTGVPDAAEV
jgi:hypothetical protein